jgi:carboxylesterase
MSDAFEIRGGRRGGVLLVHGFTGTPQEMEPLAAPLAAAGWDVVGLRLPGHGAALPDEPNHQEAWRAAVRDGFEELARTHGDGRVAVVGLSMGALLGLDLALAEPRRLAALVTLSPAISLPARLRATLRTVDWLAPRRLRARRLDKSESDIRDDVARAAHPKSAPVTVDAALSFDRLRRSVRRRIRREGRSTSLPILVVHARRDRVCPISGARWLTRRMAAASPEFHVLERSGHVIPVDLEGPAATVLVLDFLRRRVVAA